MANRTWKITRRELKSFFDSPTAYVVLIVWSVISSYFFFRAAFMIGEASLRPLFELLPWLLLFFVPAVTMRSLAAEKKDGTLEVLLTQPVNEAEVVAGKLAANVLFILIAMVLTLPIPLGLSLGGRLDTGMVAGQYLGSLFLIVGLASVGLFASSLTKNQTVAFIVALALTFALIVSGLGFIILAIPFPLTSVVRGLSAMAHFDSMIRGVISLSDIVYFIALATIFSTLSYLGLRREREARQSTRYKNLRLGTGLITIISVLCALIASTTGWRLDLTAGRLYSLSDASIKLLRELPDPVTITLYSSRQLPPEAELALRDVKDTLVDYQSAGRGRVKAIFKTPADGPGGQDEVQAAGIQLVQFNVVRQDEYQVKQGYLGISIEYQNKRETIPFVNQTSDLEYRLSSLIRKASSGKRKKIAFLSGKNAPQHGADSPPGAEQEKDEYGAWKNVLRDQYEVTDLAVAPDKPLADDIDVLVIAGPKTGATAAELKAISAFLKRGGSVLALLDGLEVNEKMGYVVPIKNNWLSFVRGFGFEVQPKLLFDMRANQQITVGNQSNQFLMPYPFWMRVGPAGDEIIVRDINSVVVPWGQPVVITKKGAGAKPLLTTTKFASAQTKDFTIAPRPDMRVNQADLATFIVAASRKLPGGGRLVVAGDSDFLKDRFTANPQSENGIFGLNAVDWLAQDIALTEIRAKNTQARRLVFPSERVRDLVRYLNLVLVPLAIAASGLARLNRRRALTKKVYGS